MRRLFIMRKDLNMSAGKLAAQVAHCAEAYWTRLLANNINKTYTNKYPAMTRTGSMQLYRRQDLYDFAKDAYERGEQYFYVEPVHACDTYGKLQLGEPKYIYEGSVVIDNDVYEQYVTGRFIKTICEARNKNHLLKAKTLADEMGLVENQDYGLIYDACFTELTPEEPDGTTLTGIWFAPLPDETAHKISKKYQLYK